MHLSFALALALSMTVSSFAGGGPAVDERPLVAGFKTEKVWLGAGDRPLGARYRHQATGFELDLVRIDSLPQAFLWVNSFPTSDKGEPHTQEHLLLGKGNVGRAVKSLEMMTLTTSSAFTMQWRTCYHLASAAGDDAFFRVFDDQLEALLFPDYTDEEIRREVRNVGIAESPDGTLRLEEQGTVYNEMVSSSDRPARRLFRTLGQLFYGQHPLSFDSGGWPAAIRDMTAEDIRLFHASTHQLGNMGMVLALPPKSDLAGALARLDGILRPLHARELLAKRPPPRWQRAEDLPPPSGATAAATLLVDFPHENDRQPGSIAIGWPPSHRFDSTDRLLLELFLDAFAGDATTPLYKIFVDSRSRERDLGARSVWAYATNELEPPILIGLSDLPTSGLGTSDLESVRDRVRAELQRIAGFGADAPELRELGQRVKTRLTERRRDLLSFASDPPRFGARGTGSRWMEHLLMLGREPGDRRSLVMAPEIAAIESFLAKPGNPWREKLEGWGLLTRIPHVVAVRPNPALVASDRADRDARLAAELAKLKTRYHLDDDQAAIRRYREDFTAKTRELEARDQKLSFPPFVTSPPMVLDAGLDSREIKTPSGAPVVIGRFASLPGASIGLAFRVEDLSRDEITLFALLPALLTRVGVVDAGRPIGWEEMSDRLRREVLALDAGFSANGSTGRVELTVEGAGLTESEIEAALAWMRRVLLAPDWRAENLSRLRDLVDQSWTTLRNRMQSAEEAWVNDPAEAWRYQADPAYLASASFLTRSHEALRLKWWLENPGSDAALAFLRALAEQKGTRAELRARLAALAEGKAPSAVDGSYGQLDEPARALIARFAKDVDATLAEIPDASLAADWRELILDLTERLARPPQSALDALSALRQRLVGSHHLRAWLATAPALETRLLGSIDALAAALPTSATSAALPLPRNGSRYLDQRLLARGAALSPFTGLVVENLKGGVFLHSVPGPSYRSAERERLLDFLASRVFAGYGPHGAFMKTWGAGLAYSNGFRGSPRSGIFGYYAERTPELPQTLRFVVDLVEKGPRESALVEYAIAQAFQENRTGNGFASRTEDFAEDLADGITPEKVRAFRSGILALRQDPKLGETLFARLREVYGRVLPGLGIKAATVPGAIYFTIGPERQLTLLEEHLKSIEGPATRVLRLYPRDYWLPIAAPRPVEERP